MSLPPSTSSPRTEDHPSRRRFESAFSTNQTESDGEVLLDSILPVLQAAIWSAWLDPLELISLGFGRGESPSPLFDPAQMRPGASWAESVYSPDHERLHAFLNGADTGDATKSFDYRLIVGEGELLWVRHWILHRDCDRHGRRRLRGLIMAIPEQKHLEWECLRVSERECNRIGQELHDDLCQVLAGLTFMMRVISQRAGRVAPALGAEINELNSHVVGATDRVRSMAHGLFPAQLNYGTLRHALQEFVRQTAARFPVQVTLALPRTIPSHLPEQIIHTYRIAQEAVSNSIRHGNATAIKIVVSARADNIQVRIEDNGKGFPLTSARPEGIGMHVMNYRARVLGGSLRFKNLSPGGAVAELVYPIKARSRSRKRAKKAIGLT